MRRMVITAVLALAVPVAVFGQAKKPDFSGRWTLDASKSDPTPQAARGARAAGAGRAGGAGGGGLLAGGSGPVLISQTDTEITIGANTYKLDGSRMPQGPRGIAEGKASWEGDKLVIETSRTIPAAALAAQPGTTLTTKEVRSLSADGNEMTVETTVNAPRGELKTKQVFTKSN